MPTRTAIPALPAITASFASLAGTYRRLSRICEPLDVRVIDTTGIAGERVIGTAHIGHSAAEFVSVPDALTAAIDGEADRVTARHGRRPRHDVAASRLLHHYLWSVGLLFSGPWYLDRRVPAIPLDRVRLEPATGALTLDVRAIECLPGTDDGGSLRQAFAAHLGPLLDAFAPHVKRGPRTLWGMATDDLASGLWFLGRSLGEEQRGIREATAVLPGATPPFPGGADFRVLRAPSGAAHPTRTRLGCCLHYAITPGDPCMTCPRMADDERLRRLESS